MNQDEKNNTERSEEYENFERLAKELLNLPPETIKEIQEQEKVEGISEDEHPEPENPNS